MANDRRALIAMSGGIDSSVCALLMRAAGYTCEGATMRLYRNADIGLSQYHGCCTQRDIDDAADVAFTLDMPFHILDYTAEFRQAVIEKFICTYEAGGTPNPCIDCNRSLKFGALLSYAAEHGFDCVATGHYARIQYDAASGRYLLRRALDASKDQSYVLYMLTQAQLARLRFPLGDHTKAQAREMAAAAGLCNARKHDSQDICFVPDGDYAAFMERSRGLTYPAGDFVDLSGAVVGRHRGAVRYTIGQRRGLGLALGAPVYVCARRMADNTVVVGPERALYARALLADEVNWIPFDAPTEPLRVMACTRYRHAPQPATARITEDGLLYLEFDAPQRAITPGQAVVLYDGDLVLGGGTIREVLK